MAKPNEWTRSASGEVSQLRREYQRYWTALGEWLEASGSPLAIKTPLAESWATFGIGRSHAQLETIVSKQKNRLRVSLRLRGPDAKAHFHLLRQEASSIEASVGTELSWAELPDREASVIRADKAVSDVLDEEDWPRQHEWMADMLERFNRVFRPLVLDLDASDWVPDDTGDDE